ncbi:MAG: asparagine synthase (glutamine-hydrolyzing) [Candidatus Sericytochromatia bacterium]
MCGITGIISLDARPLPFLSQALDAMQSLQAHRGPDGQGSWVHPAGFLGLGHQRLSIIDLASGQQPMSDRAGNWISFNGEIYNYRELRQELGAEDFVTASDTEVILQAYRRWGSDCLSRLRGMFAFILWDEAQQQLLCARDRFGIKPLYYTVQNRVLYLASEAKALLPFVPEIQTDIDGFRDYITFQFCLDGKTLFKGIHELPPAHTLTFRAGGLRVERYWQVYYSPDFEHTEKYFYEKIAALLEDSVRFHLRSDVEVGAYLSGGLDSSIVASLASRESGGVRQGFTGKFALGPDYDESAYARELAEFAGIGLHQTEIRASDFLACIEQVIYHLDYPIAGPGSFPQFMVSANVRRQGLKVVLGGQGGDEIFGGYVRYLVAYFEQCIKAAIDGTMGTGNFIVTYESILPNLIALRNYKPLLQEFWREGLFEDLDRRYFRLINRANTMGHEIRQELFTDYSPYESFSRLFRSSNVEKESYFDAMTHFDFKTLLPALLHVEDRVSMAHGIESRVPFLDHALVEMAATMPSNVKFKHGTMKNALKQAMQTVLPAGILNRTDKMGFPVPLNEWFKGELRDFVFDVFSSQVARNRYLIDNRQVLAQLEQEPKFNRKIWGLLCLELWQQRFHDQAHHFQNLTEVKHV